MQGGFCAFKKIGSNFSKGDFVSLGFFVSRFFCGRTIKIDDTSSFIILTQKNNPAQQGTPHTLPLFSVRSKTKLFVEFSNFEYIFRCVRHAPCCSYDLFVKCDCSRYFKLTLKIWFLGPTFARGILCTPNFLGSTYSMSDSDSSYNKKKSDDEEDSDENYEDDSVVVIIIK